MSSTKLLDNLCAALWVKLTDDEKATFSNDPSLFDAQVKPYLLKELSALQVEECLPSIYKRAYYRKVFETLWTDPTSQETLRTIYATFPTRLCQVLTRGNPPETLKHQAKIVHDQIQASFDLELFDRLLQSHHINSTIIHDVVKTTFHWLNALGNPSWDAERKETYDTLEEFYALPFAIYGSEAIERIEAWLGQCEMDMDHFVKAVKEGKLHPDGPPPNVHKTLPLAYREKDERK